jgi:hypothetical protein
MRILAFKLLFVYMLRGVNEFFSFFDLKLFLTELLLKENLSFVSRQKLMIFLSINISNRETFFVLNR